MTSSHPAAAELLALAERLREMQNAPFADYALDIWSCKIGECPRTWEAGGDEPMRVAVAAAYERLTGKAPTFIFSGWGSNAYRG